MAGCNGCHTIIKNVPCPKCTQRGEGYLNGMTLQKTGGILDRLKSMLTETAAIGYGNAA